MAATATIETVPPGLPGIEDAEKEKLLMDDQVLIVPARALDDGATQLVAKSSKKVKLPDDVEPAVGAGRFTIGPAPEEDWEMVPPDGRWGWCILVGATLVNILIPGTIKSFGVLFVEFTEMFDGQAAAASGIPGVCYFLYSSLGPLSSILSVKWSYRTVTLIGGSFAAFGMIFSSCAGSIGYLYISYGAMVGTGAGLAFPPTVYIVTSYFVRLRGLANGICMSGSAFGSIVLPPLLRYLLETYGYRGSVLIMGGIMLNVWAAALLFQPVEEHMVRKYREADDVPQDEILYEEDELELETIARHGLEKVNEHGEELMMEEEPLGNGSQNNDGEKPMSDNANSLNHFTNSQISVSAAGEPQTVRTNLSRRKLSYTKPPPRKTYSSSSIIQDGELRQRHGSQETFGRKLSTARVPKRSPSTSSFQYVSTPFHGSTLSAFEHPNQFASQFSLKSVSESLSPIAYCCGCRKKPKSNEKKEPSKFFDLTLLKDPTYLVIMLSSSTVAISCTNFIILLPSHAKNIGFTKSEGAYLLSTFSALDLVGRIGGSAICDLNLFPKAWFFIGGLLFSGIMLIIIPLMTSYVYVSVFCAFFGLASGINNSVTALVMADMLGVERLMSTYGISLFVNGLLQLIGPPICGLWAKAAGNYKSLFVTLGFIFILGASLWGFMPFINKRKREEERLALEAANA